MEDDDDGLYKDWLDRFCRSNGVEVWSYCLMPNPIHLILRIRKVFPHNHPAPAATKKRSKEKQLALLGCLRV